MSAGSEVRNDKASTIVSGSARTHSGLSKTKRQQTLRNNKLANERMHARMVLQSANARTKRESEDIACKQLFTRVVGGVSVFVSVVFLIVSVILMSMDCCGKHFSYDEDEWEKQCKGKIDKAAEDKIPFGTDRPEDEDEDNVSATSCYHRNIVIFVSVGFMVLTMFLGCLFITVGECMYDVNRDKDEDHVNGVASELKWLEMQQMEEDAAIEAEAREAEEYERELAEREARIERNFSERERMPRANSIGSPMTPSSGHLIRAHNNAAPSVVASVPAPYVVGNARPYQAV